jgi:hypothetical protein
MQKHTLALNIAKGGNNSSTVASKTEADAEQSAGNQQDESGGAQESSKAKKAGELVSEHAKARAIHALDVHEGSQSMAYTHIGCANHAVFFCPLPKATA